jgi:hypothetical protein
LIAPTLVNLEAVKGEIETVTSREVGGTVTARRIGLSFLPRPRIVLAEPRISIPGSVEGTLSSLDIQIRLLPLLRRTVQVSSVEIHKPDFTFTLRPDAQPSRKKAQKKQGAEKEIAALLATFTAKTAGLTTTIDDGRIEVREQDGLVVVVRDLVMTVLVPAGQRRQQTAADDGDAASQFTIAGHIDRAVVEEPGLPGPVSVRLDDFTATADVFMFKNASFKMLDGSVMATGSVPHYLNTKRTIALNGSGRVGARVVEWIRTRAGAPLEPALRTPIDAKNVNVQIRPGKDASISADLKVKGGPSIAFSLDVGSDRFVLRKGEIRDAESQAEIGFRLMQEEIEASFSGMLTRSTLDSLFIREQSERRWIRGSFRALAGRSAPFLKTFDGTLEGENLMIPVKDRMPIEIRNIALSGEGNVAQITSARVVWAAVPVEVKGNVAMQPEYAKLDLDVIAGNLDIDAIKQALAGSPTTSVTTGGGAHATPASPFPIQGEVRVAADSVSLGRFTFRPVRAFIAISPGSIRLNRAEASICGIGLTGNLEFRKKHVSFDLEAEAEDKQVEETLSCFKTKDHHITGSFNLLADISGSGMVDDFPRVLNGSFEFTALNGQINRMQSMAKILELINNTEVFRGKYPGFGNEGLKYNSISLNGDLLKGVLSVREGVMDGTIMEMAAEGSADLAQGDLDFRVAVAPLKTVDAVVKKLPFVKDILRGTLIVVPFRVTGTLSKPDVKSITLADAGHGVTGIFSRTLKAPFKFVEGLVPGENGNKK